MALPETVEQMRARQKANSLAEQRQQFFKTGRPTKGLLRAGEAVAGQNYTVRAGDNPISVARQMLGPGASASMVAAFVDQQGWKSLRPGDVLPVRPTYISRNARASAGFAENNFGAQGNSPSDSFARPVIGQVLPVIGQPLSTNTETSSQYNVQGIQSQAGMQVGTQSSAINPSGYNVQGVQSQQLSFQQQNQQNIQNIRNTLGIVPPQTPTGNQAIQQTQSRPATPQPALTAQTPRLPSDHPAFQRENYQFPVDLRAAQVASKNYEDAVKLASEQGALGIPITAYPSVLSDNVRAMMGLTDEQLQMAGYMPVKRPGSGASNHWVLDPMSELMYDIPGLEDPDMTYAGFGGNPIGVRTIIARSARNQGYGGLRGYGTLGYGAGRNYMSPEVMGAINWRIGFG